MTPSALARSGFHALCALGLVAAPLSALAGKPSNDLTVASVSGPTSAVAGSGITVNTSISWGTASGGAQTIQVSCYLSTDTTITTSDVLIGTVGVPIAPGQTVPATCRALIPAGQAPGTYYLGAFVDSDNRVAETNETNNTKAGNAITITPALPDLSLSYVSGPASATIGQTIQVNASVYLAPQSPGSVTATVSFYLSTDSTITTADRYLGSTQVTVAPNQYVPAPASVLLPPTTPLGTYSLGAIVDPGNTIAESDETNNWSAGTSLQVQADTQPPVIVVTGVSEGSVATQSPVTVCYTVSDYNPSTDLGELDLLPFHGCTSASTAGVHSLVVTATDAYGNSANQALHFFIDLAPPSVTVTSPAAGDVMSAGSVGVAAAAQDDAGIATVTANGLSLTAGADGVYRGDVPLPQEGPNAIQVTATDVAARTTSTSLTVTRDTIAPVLTLSSPPEGATLVSPIAVSGTVSDSTTTSVTVNGASVAVGPNGAFSRDLDVPAGPATITVRAVDAVGLSTAVTRNVTVNVRGSLYCYDGAGNMTARLLCPFGTDCSARCP